MKLPPKFRKFQSSSTSFPRKWTLKKAEKSPTEMQRDKIVTALRERAFALEAEAERMDECRARQCLMARVEELRDAAVSIRLDEMG